MNCDLKGGRGLSQLEGRVIIRTQNCNFNIDHLPLFAQIPTKACRHWAARCGLHKNPMLHLSYWELKPFHGFFPIRKLQFWVLTPPTRLLPKPRASLARTQKEVTSARVTTPAPSKPLRNLPPHTTARCAAALRKLSAQSRTSLTRCPRRRKTTRTSAHAAGPVHGGAAPRHAR